MEKCIRIIGEDGDDLDGVPDLSGHIFIDGSCTKLSYRKLNRATWAVAVVSPDPPHRREVTVRGNVWAMLPQTPQAAEYCAYAMLCQFLDKDKEAHAYGDCKGVVDLHAAPVWRRLSQKARYAGVLRHALSQPAFASLASLSWVKAHVADQGGLDDLSPLARFHALGNQAADQGAEDAHEQHPPFPLGHLQEHDAAAKLTKHILDIMAAVLPLWPLCAEDRLLRAAPPKPPRPPRLAAAPLVHARACAEHRLVVGGGRVVCNRCGQATTLREKGWTTQPCPSGREVGNGVRLLPSGASLRIGPNAPHLTHHLADLRGFIFCTACGAYAASGIGVRSCARYLLGPCRGEPTPRNRTVLNRLMSLRPPKVGMPWPREVCEIVL